LVVAPFWASTIVHSGPIQSKLLKATCESLLLIADIFNSSPVLIVLPRGKFDSFIVSAQERAAPKR
jgi:hypothetical protein